MIVFTFSMIFSTSELVKGAKMENQTLTKDTLTELSRLYKIASVRWAKANYDIHASVTLAHSLNNAGTCN